MPRAAGTSHVYEYKLKGRDVGPKLPSVTHILKFLKEQLGLGGYAYWGMKIGVVATLMDQGIAKFDALDDPDIEPFYEAAKETGWHPNAIRDDAAEAGTAAHEVLELAAKGEVLIDDIDGEVWVVGDPAVLAPLRYPESVKTQLRQKWIGENRNKMRARGKGLAAARWWLDNEDKHGLTYPEQPVYSVRYGYAGTMDFARNLFEETEFEIVDYKSHKPSQGMRKDGSYAEDKGPAYLDDLVQVQAYGQAFYEMGLGLPNAYRIVLLQPDGTYFEDTREVPFDLFLDFKAIHDKLCSKPECRLLAQAYGGR